MHRKFRLKWPWEQDRQMAVYNRSSSLIQVASQPHRAHMQTRAGAVDGWCLSHLPGSGCFISHYCANAHSKQVMRELYTASLAADGHGGGGEGGKGEGAGAGADSIEIHYLSFP
jgi:hypothetical protein